MQDAVRTFAGDCTITYDSGGETRVQRGSVVVLAKPDGTVLVHDAGGYQPAAWLTRADAVRYARDDDGVRLVAGTGDERLRVEVHALYGSAHYEVSPAGPEVGDCPDCGGALVRDGGSVVCIGCRCAHSIPRDATVLDETCETCGLPRMGVRRGVALTACLDRDCDPLADRLAEQVEWACPDCGDPLDVRAERGLHAVCPACDHRFRVPAAEVVGECACGLPRFGPPADRCLDPDCSRGEGVP